MIDNNWTINEYKNQMKSLQAKLKKAKKEFKPNEDIFKSIFLKRDETKAKLDIFALQCEHLYQIQSRMNPYFTTKDIVSDKEFVRLTQNFNETYAKLLNQFGYVCERIEYHRTHPTTANVLQEYMSSLEKIGKVAEECNNIFNSEKTIKSMQNFYLTSGKDELDF